MLCCLLDRPTSQFCLNPVDEWASFSLLIAARLLFWALSLFFQGTQMRGIPTAALSLAQMGILGVAVSEERPRSPEHCGYSAFATAGQSTKPNSRFATWVIPSVRFQLHSTKPRFCWGTILSPDHFFQLFKPIPNLKVITQDNLVQAPLRNLFFFFLFLPSPLSLVSAMKLCNLQKHGHK